MTGERKVDVAYSHDQFGKLVFCVMVAISGLLAALYAATGLLPLLIILVVLFVSVLMMFYRLHVEVTRNHVRVRFGVGLVRKTFDVRDILEARPVRNKWWYGFGVRRTPHGWLFNVSGLDAVEIMLRSGKRYRIGTDEPAELSRALRSAIAAAK